MDELTQCPECGSVNIEFTEISKVLFTWAQDEDGIDSDCDEEYVDVEEDTKYANIECVCLNTDCKHEWVIENKSVTDLPGWEG